MTDREEIVAAARSWIGVRWQHQGRSRAGGIDCVGLLVVVAHSLGIAITDSAGYRRRQDGRQLLFQLECQLDKKFVTDWKEGDIAVFEESAFPIHVGFLAGQVGAGTVIHAHARRRQVIEEPLAQYGQPFAVFSLREVK